MTTTHPAHENSKHRRKELCARRHNHGKNHDSDHAMQIFANGAGRVPGLFEAQFPTSQIVVTPKNKNKQKKKPTRKDLAFTSSLTGLFVRLRPPNSRTWPHLCQPSFSLPFLWRLPLFPANHRVRTDRGRERRVEWEGRDGKNKPRRCWCAFSWNRYVVLLRFVLLCSLILRHTPKKRVHAARDCEDGACRVYRTHTIEVFNITADAFNPTHVCARSACQRFKNLALLRCGQLPSHTHTHTHAIALSTAFSFDVSLRTR